MLLVDSAATVGTSDTATKVTENVEKSIDLLGKAQDFVITHAPSILIGMVVFIIGLYIAKGIRSFSLRLMEHAKYEQTVRSFISQIIYYGVLSIVIMTALTMAGFPTNSFIAAFGAIGLAIGLALQSNLSNFASGLLILIFKPFKSGDWISVNGVEGNVTRIQLLNTMIKTKENRVVFIPNSIITSNNLMNSNYEEMRYITFIVGIAYENDHHKVIAILKDIFKKNPLIHNALTVEIGIKEFGESSVNIVAYPLVKAVDFASVYYGTMSEIKDRFDAEGISIPYPQRVVHMEKE